MSVKWLGEMDRLLLVDTAYYAADQLPMMVSTKNTPMMAQSTTKAASSRPKVRIMVAIPAREANRLRGLLPLPCLLR